jgi:hypothetical protein
MYGTSLFWSDKHVGNNRMAVFHFKFMKAWWYYSGSFTADRQTDRHNSESCLKEVKKFADQATLEGSSCTI